MSTRTRFLSVTALALALSLAASPASAGEQIVSAKATLGYARSTLLGPARPARAELLVPAFDPALGTLRGVLVSTELVLKGRAGVENLAPTPTLAQSAFSALFVARRADGLELGLAHFQSQHATWLEPADGAVDYAGSAGWTNVLATGSTLDRSLAPDARWIARPAEPGAEVKILLDLFGEQLVDGWQVLAALSLAAEVEVTVVYLYE